MLRTGLVVLGLAVAMPILLAAGATFGFLLLAFLYVAFGLDFPTEISIAVGLMPVGLAVLAWWHAAKRLLRRSSASARRSVRVSTRSASI